MPSLFSLDNLYRQYLHCRRHKRYTHNALRFEVHLEEHLVRLREELEGRTYYPSRSVCFLLKQPKFREIFAADFRDRVVHHVLVGALERDWERRFIHDSYACRTGKGTHRAVGRLHTFMRRVTHNGTRPGSNSAQVLTCSSKEFFSSLGENLPGGANGVLGNQWIGCENSQFMLNGLADQHAIKGVFVKGREFWQTKCCFFF